MTVLILYEIIFQLCHLRVSVLLILFPFLTFSFLLFSFFRFYSHCFVLVFISVFIVLFFSRFFRVVFFSFTFFYPPNRQKFTPFCKNSNNPICYLFTPLKPWSNVVCQACTLMTENHVTISEFDTRLKIIFVSRNPRPLRLRVSQRVKYGVLNVRL